MRSHRRALAALGLLALAGCDSISDSLGTDPDEVVRIELSASTAPADGWTKVVVDIRIPPSIEASSRTLTVTTDLGAFVQASGSTSTQVILDTDSTGFATVRLQAPTRAGTALVQARAGAFATSARVEFVRVGPLRIDVDPGVFALSASPFVSTTIRARLVRGQGFASEGTAVQFSVQDAAGRPFGTLSEVTLSGTNGESTARFSAGDTAFRGRAVVIAQAADPFTGQTVRGSNTFDIVD